MRRNGPKRENGQQRVFDINLRSSDVAAANPNKELRTICHRRPKCPGCFREEGRRGGGRCFPVPLLKGAEEKMDYPKTPFWTTVARKRAECSFESIVSEERND